MLQINQLKMSIDHTEEQLKKKLITVLRIRENDLCSYEIIRRSVDARKKPELYYIYCVEVAVKNEDKIIKAVSGKKNGNVQITLSNRVNYSFPQKERELSYRPVIVGAGPCGLFCAYSLALAGCKPILLERGYSVEKRMEAVDRYWNTGVLDTVSNVQFGEGGAGTFSDGKLNTLVKDKYGRNRAVLEVFVNFGADSKILYDAKPHIGTDVLCSVVKNMRNEIIALGGEVRFESMVTDILLEDSLGDKSKKVKGVVVNGKEIIETDQVVLAVGHSARDTFALLQEKKADMEAKPFAVGFRVQHAQKQIDFSQYGMQSETLGAAPYKVTAQTSSGRGVYSFCMCPGGYVVNASSEEGYLAINGMSYSKRNSQSANSAIIVAVTPKDYPGDDALAGVRFQRELEKKAYDLAKGKIPMQLYGEFREKVLGKKEFGKVNEADENGLLREEIIPCFKGQYEEADLTGILPMECNEAFVEGMEHFGKMIKGFNHDHAIMAGVESRTSSPLRILRDEHLEANWKGFYPCGEGAGYAGGITSAAMDGLKCAEEILCAR